MTIEEWLAALATELRRRGVEAGAVVAEAASHLRESGQPPLTVFGPPAAYAAALTDSLNAPRPREYGPARLDVRDVAKRYGGRTVLSGVNLQVRAGQVAAIVGANGCGKSTLLRICAGLETADSGEVTRAAAVGYCPQSGGTADFLTADEHFVLVGAGRGMDRAGARDQGRRGAADLDWRDTDRDQARHLSGGTRQKLNLVMADIGAPELMLLDEPYQGFDHGSYLDFWQQVWGWRDAGRAVVVVTHLLNATDRVDVVLDLTRPGQTRQETAA
jgi:ABC-type multidrug transport system ATPase subunit